MKLEGTVALITGGAKRVGRAIGLALGHGGCDIAVHHRTSHVEADDLVRCIGEIGRRAVAVPGDLSDSADWPRIVQRTVGELGRLDILINNASVFAADSPDTVDDFDADKWERMLCVNLIAPMALVYHARPHLEARGDGRIVNLCDISADRPWPDHLAYCCSKAALGALTKGLARALAPHIKVNGIAPGIAIFPEEYSPPLRSRLTDEVPLGRAGTPEEVARLVRFVVESGDYMTGEIIRIDGGRSIV